MKVVLKWLWAWFLVVGMAASIHNGDLALAALLAAAVFLTGCDWIVEAISQFQKAIAEVWNTRERGQ